MSNRPWRVVANHRVVAAYRKLKHAAAHALTIQYGGVRHVSGAAWVMIAPCTVGEFVRMIRHAMALRQHNVAAIRRAAAANVVRFGIPPKRWRQILKTYEGGRGAAVMAMAFHPQEFQEAAP